MTQENLRITADENIPQVKRAFENIGTLRTLPGRGITRHDLTETDLLLVRSVTRVDRSLLEGTPVRFVASATAGFDHVDTQWLEHAGIAFARAPGSNALSAAEFTIAAICYWSLERHRPLRDLRLGVIGCGHVGSRVARLAEALGLQCIRNDPPLADMGERGFSSLEDALACDIVTLHVPLEKNSAHPTAELIDEHRLNALQAGTLLINAARGEIIDESALKQRLQSRGDIDAILDVWHNEPDIDPELLSATMLGTPHIAGYSADAKLRGTQMIYRACCQFLGREATWKPQLPDGHTGDDVENFPDIRQRILAACDIAGDSRRLRKLLQSNDNPALYFDHLRKNYPVRREYSGDIFGLFKDG